MSSHINVGTIGDVYHPPTLLSIYIRTILMMKYNYFPAINKPLDKARFFLLTEDNTKFYGKIEIKR